MSDEKRVHHLTVFLIKPSFGTTNQVLKTEDCEAPVAVAIAGYGSGTLFVKRTPPHLPKWAGIFKQHIDVDSLAVPGVSAAFFIEVDGRCFVLSFGQAGRFLIKDEVAEERFGLICALNAVDPKTFRCVDVQSLDAIDSHTRIQSGQETTPDQFGLSVEQDMLKAIVGAPSNPALGTRMAGSDGLSVSVRMDLPDLPVLLNAYREMFETNLSAEDHQWVNNIAVTKNSVTIAALEAALNARFAADQLDGVWLSIPEIIEWATVRGFIYTRGKGAIHPDINMQGFRKTVDGPITLDLLRERKVHCADADHNHTFKSWTVYKCLYAEVEHDGSMYVLNDGKWYGIAKDFAERTKRDFAAIPASNLTLPAYEGGGEGAYNEGVARSDPATFNLLDDKKKIMHGGGHGQVEVCDLLTVNRELVHVKMYGKSSVLSHLFAQGFVSGQLLQIDAEFRQKVKDQLSPTHKGLIDAAVKPAAEAFTIVYAIISEEPGEGLHLPFFSRVNLNNTRKVLHGYGFKVELLKIAVDSTYARTIKVPSPKKIKKAAG